MPAPERIYVPWRRSDRTMGPPQIDEHDAIVDAATYVGEHPEDWEASAYTRADVAAARLAAVEAERDEALSETQGVLHRHREVAAERDAARDEAARAQRDWEDRADRLAAMTAYRDAAFHKLRESTAFAFEITAERDRLRDALRRISAGEAHAASWAGGIARAALSTPKSEAKND